ATVVVEHSDLAGVTALVATGYGDDGQVVFGPVRSGPVASLRLDPVPTSVATLGLEYEGRPSSWRTAVVLDPGEVFTVQDPPRVDLADPVLRSFAFLGCNRV